MKPLVHFLLTGAITAGLVAGNTDVQAQAKQIPMRDFFKNPQEAGHQISPDGKYLSWVAPYERRLNVHVRPLAGGPTGRVTSETARDISGYFWKGERILYVKDFGGDENFHVVSVNLKGEDLKDLTPGEKYVHKSSMDSSTTTNTSSFRTTSATRKYLTCSAPMLRLAKKN